MSQGYTFFQKIATDLQKRVKETEKKSASQKSP